MVKKIQVWLYIYIIIYKGSRLNFKLCAGGGTFPSLYTHVLSLMVPPNFGNLCGITMSLKGSSPSNQDVDRLSSHTGRYTEDSS